MTINIKPNDYKEVTECRENVVQGICDAFLCSNCWTTFHPNSDGAYRTYSNYLLAHDSVRFYGFHGKKFHDDLDIKIRKCEVELAIELLLKAGYHLYRVHKYGTWVGYKISGNPRLTNGEKVSRIYNSDWSGYFK